MTDPQEEVDLEEVQLRLERLVDAINNTSAAAELVKNLRQQLQRAEATLKSCKAKEMELAFLERRRRKR